MERKLLIGHTDAVEEVHITPWNIITGSHDTNIHIYSLDAELDWKFKEHKEKILSMAVHISKPLFASAAYQSNPLWLCNFINKGKTSVSIPLTKPTVAAGALTFGNESFAEILAIGVQDEEKKGSFGICNVNESSARLTDTMNTSRPVQCVARPPIQSPLSRQFVFSCSEEKLYLYDTTYHGSKKVSTVAINSDRLIRHSNKQGVGHNIHDCSFSPNGLLLQSCGEDNTVVVHDVRNFSKPLFVLEHDYMGGAHGVACQWSNDSRFLVSGADDCTVRLWDVGRGLATATAGDTVDQTFGFINSEVNLIKHNQSGAICALSLSIGSDMVVAGSTSGRIVVHGMRSYD
uniref:Uncharacterized protein n=1 Tax=Lotharella oceanica TaxID=641309 RepID=A0A7S2TQA0_9EUKA